MQRSSLVALIPLSLILSGCLEGRIPEAEAAASEAVAVTFVDALAADAATLERKVIGLAEALSADQYTWRPGEGVLSAGEVLMHVAAYNYYYPSMAGAEIPAGVGVTTDYSTVSEFESSRSDRAEIIEALETSFTHLRSAIGELSEAELGQPVQVFGNQSSVQAAWMGTLTHIHEHLGQLIAYARMNDVVPPWSS